MSISGVKNILDRMIKIDAILMKLDYNDIDDYDDINHQCDKYNSVQRELHFESKWLKSDLDFEKTFSPDQLNVLKENCIYKSKEVSK